VSAGVERPGLPALALTTDTSFITAYANDIGFEGIFERQVLALGKPGDVLVAISTSGHSKNVSMAVAAARTRGLHTIGLVGEDGPLANFVDHALVVRSRNTQHLQECFLSIEHVICGIVEQTLFAANI
jgi:D-sedoheptulose 7-phosphate isomerase